jgi:TRAP-type C4-dicarboxylate transport system substrate-binding protein
MIRHQTTVSRLGVSALGGIAVAAMMTATPAVGLEIKTSDVHGEGYPTTEAIRYMGDLLSAWTNGRITVNLFPSMQLGGEKEALEQTQPACRSASSAPSSASSTPSTCRTSSAASNT